MDDAVPLLDRIASCQQVLGVVVSDLFEGAVFTLFGGPICHDGHCNLNVCVAHLRVSEDEVAFQLSDASDTDLATLCAGVAIDDVLQHGPVVDAVVGESGVIHCFREAALEDAGVEFRDRARVHGQFKEALHLAILAEVQRLHPEFDVAPAQLRGYLTRKQIGV